MDRFAELTEAKAHTGEGLEAARRYVTAMLGLQVWSHKLYGAVHAAAHEGSERHHG